MRHSEVSRETAETAVKLSLELDGSGRSEIDTGVGFLDHMLTLLALHGGFDLAVSCKGDLNVDAHHSVEEIARIIGVDSLGFLNVEHLPKLADHSTCGFCNGCFTGNYPVDPPRDTAKLKFERSLTERQKTEEGNL